ncbi:Lipopolysaccharide export system permease protein LptG [Legionella massiliensis]|uniref:Lipopolysaccharide export system permease protein LptG n=2 Tax=Legionella massiliensis TaxID=1034943 RepID=A0A078KRE3_9GAMM|nr:Lipopolysaccharide export system permease protein LptG [Legionella massiliensis]CEE12718.1 Lipopolysaccharide export system permease protein LptG [Legionella massiliensis]
MKLLDRYIAKTVFAAIGLVTLMLIGLQIFILFVNQLDDLGKADFNIVQAAFFVFLQVPYQVYLFFPMASLLGCLIGLGIMANNRELIVMRAAGMSIGQVTLAVLKVALILILFVTIIGETLIPKLSHYANDRKTLALSGGQTLRTNHGVWLRNRDDFIFISAIVPGNSLRFVYQFRFDETHHLRFARVIHQIDYVNNLWMAHWTKETVFDKQKTEVRFIPDMVWDVSVRPKVLSVSTSEPDEMTLRELRRFLRAQKLSHQNAFNYQLAFWQRIIQPLTTVVMMILAIPFIFGPLRSSTMGSKLVAGATVGFGFHIMNKFFGPISLVFQWPPELAAVGPTLIFALLGLYLMRKVR